MATETVTMVVHGRNGQPISTQAAQVEVSVESANERSLLVKAQQALALNATYLAITTPTAAQNTAQAKALTRQVNALIKLLLNDLADVNGT